jgi:hypothetical protein
MKTSTAPHQSCHLTLRDLLEAREAYHVHLTRLDNVVATAVGFYRIRKNDPDADNPASAGVRPFTNRGLRTLENSVVTEWSVPAVLVFVRQWEKASRLKPRPDQIVPPRLYLPDGRVVRTCVLVAPPALPQPALPGRFDFPDDLIGGGYPVFTQAQGLERVSSLACLVSDGAALFALTNRHATGEPDSPIFSLLRGDRTLVGLADRRQLDKLPFERAYPGWPGRYTLVNFDAALVRIADANQWTAQVFGLGALGAPVDVNSATLSLDWLRPERGRVRAFGCASGEMRGQIEALFFRYRAIGGIDYVADLLIGPQPGAPAQPTRPGDSGTLWVLDDPVEKALRPLAMQWGGHRVLAADGTVSTFALGTFVSTICRELGVEIVTDWNTGLPEYWGQVGHYKIGAIACTLATNAKLKKLLNANIDRIGLTDSDLTGKAFKDLDPDRFIPLADVPDDVWKKAGYMRAKDKPNHYADMDQEGSGTFAGKTLWKLCEQEANVNLQVWSDFYDSLGTEEKYRGILPFRVWQLYNEMLKHLADGQLTRFLCVAGILAHYIGDACQPLHASYLHDGDPTMPGDAGVHSAYETAMLSAQTVEFINDLADALNGKTASPQVTGGKQAALATIALMRRTATTLPPMEVIIANRQTPGGPGRSERLWEKLGPRTIQCIADGALTLTMLWESAWRQGNGGQFPNSKLKALSKTTLRNLCIGSKIAPSRTLKEFISEQILGS